MRTRVRAALKGRVDADRFEFTTLIGNPAILMAFG